MTVRARFETTALILCALGVIVIVSGLLGSSGGAEPGKLPVQITDAKPILNSDSPPVAGTSTQDARDHIAPPSLESVVVCASHQVVGPANSTIAFLGADDGDTEPAEPPQGDASKAPLGTPQGSAPGEAAKTAPGEADQPSSPPTPSPDTSGSRTAVGDNQFNNVRLAYTDSDGHPQAHDVAADAALRTRPKTAFTLSGKPPAGFQADHRVVLQIDGQYRLTEQTLAFSPPAMPVLSDGPHTFSLSVVDKTGARVDKFAVLTFGVRIRTSSVHVKDVDASSLTLPTKPYRFRVVFDTGELAGSEPAGFKRHFSLIPISATGAEDRSPLQASEAVLHSDAATAEVSFNNDLGPGAYRLRITGLQDLYGNGLAVNNTSQTSYDRDFLRPVGVELPSVRAGVRGRTGEYVPFAEFTKPRDVPDGFNPNDKVEARVVRLYYYRDAHRVAQIVNRKVQSYNRQGVDMARQLADKARGEADQRTIARQQAERAAIIKAQETRQQETALQAVEQSLDRSLQELTNYRRGNPKADPQTDPTIKQLQSLTDSFTTRVNGLRVQVQNLRAEEVAANELVQQEEAQEKLAREEQFRREVAAAHEDPDTYAPGVPTSNDPVEQVSVSVIGEGLIHLRGPLKGINVIRMMIDQIDQPVGQVRVSVHTVQINGEKEERMEDVANIIQRYIDHARFLTMQSSEMLRRSVVQVASRKAEEALAQYPGQSQEDRDRRYLYAFFGQDFISELEAIDSEFLRTGNKLLSLHSMDTTSLSSALNLLALAKNTTRMEIFQEFDSMVQGQLPCAEANYLEAGLTVAKKRKLELRCPPKFYPLAQNAKFESLRGFFNTEIVHEDTMTPLQREFVRLAQIFKSRLITELEYKQRVMERAVIEERIGNRLKELQDARDRETAAQTALEEAKKAVDQQRQQVVRIMTQVRARFDNLRQLMSAAAKSGNFYLAIQTPPDGTAFIMSDAKRVPIEARTERGALAYEIPQAFHEAVKAGFERELVRLREVENYLATFNFKLPRNKDLLQKARQWLKDVAESSVGPEKARAFRLVDNKTKLEDIDKYFAELVEDVVRGFDFPERLAGEIVAALSSPQPDVKLAYEKFWQLREQVLQGLEPSDFTTEIESLLDQLHNGLLQLFDLVGSQQRAEADAQTKRRPLDHKKFLDMLIDDLEEKYIELLDGTRAHTANVDNYLKRLTTALDDDFNTQFYYPAFRYIRETGTSWDVQFGQTETTSILANNRDFAKVEPSATMEFDLPARDILLAEAMDGAKAMIEDVGALANDPTFLAMAKMQTNSAANPAPGATRGFGVVRDVLPGLDSSTAEQIMAHNAGDRPQFGSNLENLIPDPAIYKFETGTGYEVRPVIQPDGQAVVFDFNYMYTTNIREPVRADEKHLGRVKRHFVHTDVQLSNFELREVSRYTVALKAARTSRGVPLLEDIPVVGVLWRPLPSDESSLQQNIILGQATIFPTLFDLMGLRWAPAVSDLDPLRVSNREFIVRGRHRALENRVYDYASGQVDEFLRIPEGDRRTDLYRTQETIPYMHPNGYQGPGMDLRDSQLQEGYQPGQASPQDQFIPGESKEGAPFRPGRSYGSPEGTRIESFPLEKAVPGQRAPAPIVEPANASVTDR